MSEENPCTSIFEHPDGTIAPEAKYLYKHGTRFENSGGEVAIDTVYFIKRNFINYKKAILNKQTSLADLIKVFANACKRLRLIEVPGEGKLQVIELREDKQNVSDGQVKIFIKKGGLYFIAMVVTLSNTEHLPMIQL